MSNKSISRLVVVAQASPITFNSMLTLTYPIKYPTTGIIVKEDINYITIWIKRNLNSEYLWFLEFQRRGAPHVHIMLQNEEISPYQRASVGLTWTKRIVTSEWFESWLLTDQIGTRRVLAREAGKIASVACHHKAWELIKSPNGARHYVTKYAAKAYQKEVPKRFKEVGRFWGCSNMVRPEVEHEIDVTEDEVRQFLKDREHVANSWELLPKYIFNVHEETDQNNGVKNNGSTSLAVPT